MIRSIAHPTDLSSESLPAFEHALRLALLHRCEFTVIHVGASEDDQDWGSFPGVRETMTRWGFLRPGARREDVLSDTGVSVKKVAIDADDVVGGLALYIHSHSTDALVMASHGRAGVGALLNPSIATELAQISMLPTLILGPTAKPFVDSATGSHAAIKTVLVPVDREPNPELAVRRLDTLVRGLDVEFDYVHVGSKAPVVFDGRGHSRHVRTVQGPVVETLLAEAEHTDLIAMPMTGRDGLLDALRGSTTERIVRDATRPVLALPAD